MPTYTQQHIPVAFLTYADDRKNLGNLIHEQKAVRAIFEKLKGKGDMDWCECFNLEVDEIYTVFEETTPDKPITIWHYAGHSEDYEMLLMNGRANASGINQFIAEQKTLRLVFLNACVTHSQAQDLVDKGIPAVVATTEPVNDKAACVFAQRFYASLAVGQSIQEAFNTAKSMVKAHYGNFEKDRKSQEKILEGAVRGSKELFPDNKEPLTGFEPWVLLTSNEVAGEWTLQDAIHDPYAGLPSPVITHQELPLDPYRSLRHYTENETELFFGRGWEIRALYHMITNDVLSKILLLYGQSGVGKSSLLNAGLMPRIQQNQEVSYYRRDAQEGILKAFQSVFGKLKSTTGAEVLIAWKATERRLQRPLTIILDQLEEIFTIPNSKNKKELSQLLEIIHTVFRDKENRPEGKVILSYRKEFHPEIETAFEQRPEMTYLHYFLEPLREQNIVESIRGINKLRKTQDWYRLSFENNLPEKIAHDLAKDRTSAIGPTLQILLDRLWQEVKTNQQREFTEKLYQRVLGDGKVMEHFLKTQLDAIAREADYAKYMKAGLALDVLHHHVTDLGTSDTHNRDDLKVRYQHLLDKLDLDAFIECLTAHYLLTQDKGKNKDKNTSLMHDTLGPLVQKAYRDSNAAGQKAVRVLESKLLGVEKITSAHYLSGNDLKIIKKGKRGMRNTNMKEDALIRKGKADWRKLVFAIFFSIALMIFLAWRVDYLQKDNITQSETIENQQQKLAAKEDSLDNKELALKQSQKEINRKNNLLAQREIDIEDAEKRLAALGVSVEANRIYQDNPDRSIRLAYQGYQQSGASPPPSVQNSLTNSFYAWLRFEDNYRQFQSKIQLKHWQQTQVAIVQANWEVVHLGGKQLKLANLKNGQVKNITLPFAPDANQSDQIKLSPNAQYLVYLSESAPYVYDIGRGKGHFLSKDVGFAAVQLCFSPDSKQVAVLSEDRWQVSVYTIASQQLKTYPRLDSQAKTLQFYQANQLLIASNHALFRYELGRQRSTKICDTGLSIEKILVAPQRQYLLLINEGSPKVEIWTPDGQPILDFMPHYLRKKSALKINNIAFSNQSTQVYFPYEDGSLAVIWLPPKIYQILRQMSLFTKGEKWRNK